MSSKQKNLRPLGTEAIQLNPDHPLNRYLGRLTDELRAGGLEDAEIGAVQFLIINCRNTGEVVAPVSALEKWAALPAFRDLPAGIQRLKDKGIAVESGGKIGIISNAITDAAFEAAALEVRNA